MQFYERTTISSKFVFLFCILVYRMQRKFSVFSVYLPYIKKFFILFLVSTILFNIFVTRNQEFKNKFILALDCAINTIESTVFNEYTNKMLIAVNGIMQSLALATGKAVSTQKSNKTDKKQHIPTNSSNEEVVITKKIYDVNFSINFIKTKLVFLCYSILKQLNIIYNIHGINNKIATIKVGILLFILFSIFIVRRKDEISKNILKVKVENRLAY